MKVVEVKFQGERGKRVLGKVYLSETPFSSALALAVNFIKVQEADKEQDQLRIAAI